MPISFKRLPSSTSGAASFARALHLHRGRDARGFRIEPEIERDLGNAIGGRAVILEMNGMRAVRRFSL